jgi:hypothetical protein
VRCLIVLVWLHKVNDETTHVSVIMNLILNELPYTPIMDQNSLVEFCLKLTDTRNGVSKQKVSEYALLINFGF